MKGDNRAVQKWVAALEEKQLGGKGVHLVEGELAPGGSHLEEEGPRDTALMLHFPWWHLHMTAVGLGPWQLL